MNAVEIEEAISALAEKPFDSAEFPFEFLQAFGHNETTIKKLKKGATNKSDLGGVLNNHSNNIQIVVCEEGKVADNFLTWRDRSPNKIFSGTSSLIHPTTLTKHIWPDISEYLSQLPTLEIKPNSNDLLMPVFTR